jgi:hypothetical protein
MVVNTYNPSTQQQRQEDHEFKASLCYIVSWRTLGLHSETLSEKTPKFSQMTIEEVKSEI